MPDFQTRMPRRDPRRRPPQGTTQGTGSQTTGTQTTGSNQQAVSDLQLSGAGLDATIAAGQLLRLGSTGAAVLELQAMLGITQSGEFDAATKAAVERFQLSHSLGVDGVVGSGTLAALHQVAADRASAPAGSEILFEVTTTGASAGTASQDGLRAGVGASQTMADTDEARILAMKDHFQTAADRYGLPAALLAAIASRETRGGNLLNDAGYSQYDGNGFGVMQVDKRYHEPQGSADSLAHIDQAASILADYRDQVADAHPDWSEAMILRGAVAAYNTGPGDVRSYTGVDSRTTGGDYSADVWARARRYARLFGEAPIA